MGLWATFMEAIPAYTGLTPVTFFTLVAVLVAVYHLVSGMFAAPEPPRGRDFVPMEPIPQPVQLGEVTEEELKSYDGTDPKKPLLMAIKGQIYDVSQSRMFYGPGGPYALFAGKDASRALAKMSFEEKDLTGDLEGLGPFELDALQDWEYKFMGKYVKVGQIKNPAVKEVEVSGSGNAPDADIKKPAVKEVEVSGSGNAPDADHSTREVQVNEESSVDVTEAVNIAKEVAGGTTNDETQDGEEAAKPKENGVEPKEDIDGTKDPAEISEALEDALVEKKNVELVHEANHAVPVA